MTEVVTYSLLCTRFIWLIVTYLFQCLPVTKVDNITRICNDWTIWSCHYFLCSFYSVAESRVKLLLVSRWVPKFPGIQIHE